MARDKRCVRFPAIGVIFALAVALCLAAPVRAQTNVSGPLSADTTWTLVNSPYIVTGNVHRPGGRNGRF